MNIFSFKNVAALAVCAVTFAHSEALAQAKRQAATKKQTPAATVSTEFIGRSAAARQDKSFSVLLGLGFMPRLGGFFGLAYALKPSMVLEGFYETGGYSILGMSSQRMRTGLRNLWFPGNSFYLSSGFNFESYSGTESFSLNADNSDQNYEGTHQQIEVEVGLGNRWQFDSGFTIGATWFGISQGIVPLGMSSSSKGISDELKKEQDDDLSKSAKSTSVHFAKLLLGWSF